MSTSPDNLARQVWRDPLLLLAFGFGTGLSPRAPGTAGSLLALLLFPLIALLSPAHYLLLVAVVAVVGTPVCGIAAKRLGVHDHSGIVLDEIAGLWLALFALPMDWVWMLVGFIVFRAFDILKPWPINWFDRRLSGGIGIMLDDLVAGAFTWLVLAGLRALPL